MKNFIFQRGTKMIFGTNQIQQVGKEVKAFKGTKVLLMYGKNSIKQTGLYDKVVDSLNAEGIEYVDLAGIKPNPSIESVREGKRLIEQHQLDFILAVGGGSVIDCAKAVTASVGYDKDPWDFLLGKATFGKVLPIGTILTLAATGSEMNSGAVISNEATEEKLSFGHPSVLPVFSFEDPTLMYTLPSYQTAAGASDIVAHLLEQYFSSHEDEGISDRLTEAVMINVMNYARIAIDEPHNYDARANLMWSSTLGLNGILGCGRQGGDWACHRIEHELSAIYDMTHGAGLAILFPNVLKFYLEQDNEQGLSIKKFINLGRNVFKLPFEDDYELANAVVESFRKFFSSLGMPAYLEDEGVDSSRIGEMANKAVRNGNLGLYHSVDQNGVDTILRYSLKN